MKLILLTLAAGFCVADATVPVVKPSRIAATIIDFVIFISLSPLWRQAIRTWDFFFGFLRRADDRFQV
jgi:hypothetical protein